VSSTSSTLFNIAILIKVFLTTTTLVPSGITSLKPSYCLLVILDVGRENIRGLVWRRERTVFTVDRLPGGDVEYLEG
jgi:hypothetical protein